MRIQGNQGKADIVAPMPAPMPYQIDRPAHLAGLAPTGGNMTDTLTHTPQDALNEAVTARDTAVTVDLAREVIEDYTARYRTALVGWEGAENVLKMHRKRGTYLAHTHDV